MNKFKEYLTEVRGVKFTIGNDGKYNYGVKINGLRFQDFYKRIFGQQLDDIRFIQEWKKTAKVSTVGAKMEPTIKAVRQWVKDEKPNEFYAKWEKDSRDYKDSSVEVYYK